MFRTSLRTLALSACALATGCSTQPSEPLRQRSQALDERAFITAGPEAVEMLTRLLGSPPDVRATATGDGENAGAVLLEVPASALPELSGMQHEEHGRCGGFMQHDSEEEGRQAIAEMSDPALQTFRLAPTYTVDNAATVDALFPELKEANVLATIRKLSSYRNRFHTSMTGLEASMWIRDTWSALAKGRDDIEVKLVDHDKTPQPSIAMTIRGAKLPDEIVVLGGHMDSISGRGGNNVVAPGADDNASGIGVLTEIARAAIALGYRPDRTVVFYGYAAEEIGLVGSAEIAAQAAREQLNVVAVMQLDMTNFTSAAAPYVALIRDNTSPTLNQFSIKLIETYLDMPWKYHDCGYGCSDHASWTKSGFPSTFPHEAIIQEGNKQIHTTNDTLALSKDSVAHSMHFARFGAAFLAEAAKGSVGQSAGTCSASAPCKAGEQCESGMCKPMAGGPVMAGSCPATPCAGGSSCQNGSCVATGGSGAECDANKPCPSGASCQSGTCKPIADAGAPNRKPDAGAPSVTPRDPAGSSDGDDDDAPSDVDEIDEPTDDSEDDEEYERDENAARAAGSDGCSAGHGRPDVLAGLLALALMAARRRSRTRRVSPSRT